MQDDPRVPGGTYWNAYWRDTYTVEAIWSYLPASGIRWFTVRWSDGHTTTHCTDFDHRDKIVSVPC